MMCRCDARLPSLLFLVCAAGAAAKGDGPVPIEDTVPATDAVVQRGNQLGSIAELNRVTFYPNIRDTAGPEHWVVFYCVDWYLPCVALRQAYMDFASIYERKHNAGVLFQLKVRYAEVKCTVDKPLCNEQDVQMYPTVVHYTAGKPVATWSSNGGKHAKEIERLAKFLEQAMTPSTVLDVAAKEEVAAAPCFDLWSLSAPQQHPMETALRVVLFAAALVGCVALLANSCSELAGGLQQLCATPGADRDLAKVPVQQEQTPGLAARLPEAWRQRPSIEL